MPKYLLLFCNIAHYVRIFLGMDVLNSAIESICKRVPAEKWEFVSVAVAPSTITITEHGVSLLAVLFTTYPVTRDSLP